jgi:hypothetical protein
MNRRACALDYITDGVHKCFRTVDCDRDFLCAVLVGPGKHLHRRASRDVHRTPSLYCQVASSEDGDEAVGVVCPSYSLQSGVGDLPPVHADGSPDLSKLFFHGHGCSHLQKGRPRLQPCEIPFSFLVFKLPLSHLYLVVLVDEDSYVFNMCLERLMTT